MSSWWGGVGVIVNSTAESEARLRTASVMEPELVRVRTKVSWRGGMCLPDEKGSSEEEAVFSVITYGDNWAIDKAVSKDVEIDGGRAVVSVADVNEYRRLLVKRSLLSWTLDIPIERDRHGWMTPRCYERVSRVPAPLLDVFVRGLEASVEVTDDEERKVSRQCATLFSRTGSGVYDPCEAVSMFCTLGNYWEKFGLDKEKLPRMPYKEYLLLKMVISKEGDAARVAARPRPQANTRIAGAGGRTRPSRGISTPA
jgi:hypothetical protein